MIATETRSALSPRAASRPTRRRGVRGAASLLSIFWLTLALLTVSALGACRLGGGQPDVILVTIDGLRADRVGALGVSDARTPTLDALAADGTVFEHAFASSPISLPSHATLLTGLEPGRHGLRDDGDAALDPSIDTAAARLAARGYDTAAVVGSATLDGVYGLARGFATYDDEMPWNEDRLHTMTPRRSAEEVTRRALAWLEEDRPAPRLLWVQYADLNAPRHPPAPFDGEEDDYAAALAYVDTQLGRLLEPLRAAERSRETLILVVGSHGEALGAHGESEHGLLAYDATLHVPLIAVGPGFSPGTRSAAFVQTRDVTPTLLAAADAGAVDGGGLPLAESLGGGDAARIGSFETLAPQRRFAWSPIRGVRDARWKYTAQPGPVELYDVLADPGETRNLADDAPEVVARLQQAHESILAAEGAAGATPPVSAAAEAAPDPRRVVDQLPAVDLALGLASTGRMPEAIGVLQIIAEDQPALRARALQALAAVNRSAGRTEASIDANKEWVALTGSVDARVGLAAALLDASRPEEARAALEGLDSASPRVRIARGEALRLLGRYDEALAETAALRSIHPHDDQATALEALIRVNRDGTSGEIDRLTEELARVADPEQMVETRALLAQLLIEEERFEEAAKLLRTGPAPPKLKAMLGGILADHGRVERAIQLYESALVERPGDPVYRRALADLYASQNRTDDALAVYDALLAVDPDDATLYADRGAVRHTAGRLDQAESDYRQALALDDGLAETHYNLALIERAAGHEDEAEQHLLRAVEIRDGYSKAHLLLARIYGERDDPRSAFHAERAVTSDPAAPEPGQSEGDSPRP